MNTWTIHQWLTILAAAVCAKAYTYNSGLSSGISCDNGEDYMADPDCTQFWRCANGKPFRFACPAGLHFNVDASVCDWPENAGCTGSGGGSSGGGGGTGGGHGGGGGGGRYHGSNSGHGSGDSGYHANGVEDTTYPYQPGGGKYYTEAPRATRAPVYRPIHRPKRPVYRPDHNSGGGSSGGGHSGDQHRSDGGGQRYDYSSGSGQGSRSNAHRNSHERGGRGGATGDSGGAYDQRSWGGGDDHDFGGGDYDSGRNDYDMHYSQPDYDSGSYYSNKGRVGGGTWGGYKSGRNGGGWSYKTGRGGASFKRGWNGGGRGGYFDQHSGGNYGRFTGKNSGTPWQPSVMYPPSFGKQPLPWSGPWQQQQQQPSFGSGGVGRSQFPSGQVGPVGGIPVQHLSLKPSFGSHIPGTFGSSGVGRSQFPSDQMGPVGGIPVQRLSLKPSFGSHIPGAEPVGGIPVFKQQAFGRNSFSAAQPVGAIPVIKRPAIGGVGGTQTVGGAIHLPPVLVSSGGQAVKTGVISPGIKIPPGRLLVQPVKPGIVGKAVPVRLGKPNVGMSTLGQAFIPVIQKNPRLSQLLLGGAGGGVGVGGNGYLQFNPLAGQAQGVAMNDWGGWGSVGSHTGTVGTGTGTIGGNGMVMVGGGVGPGMIGSGGIIGGGTGQMIHQPIMAGSSGLSKILLPVRFVHPSSSASTTTGSTTSSSSSSMSSTTTGPNTTPAPRGPINIIINPFIPPTLPLTETPIPLPRRGGVVARAGGGVSPTASSSSLLNNVFQNNPPRGVASPSHGNAFDFSQFSPAGSGSSTARRCTARRGSQVVTMPLVQQSGNALTDRKCRALGQLINSFVFVYVENLPGQPDGSCAVQVPEIRVTCNTGSGSNAAFSG